MVVANVAVCKRESHRVGQFVCADVCEVVVVDVLFGHTGRLVVDDVDVSAVAVRLADKSVGDGGILARIGVQIFEVGVVKQEFRIRNRAVKHRDRYVDALFCEHISRFGRESEVRIGLLLVLDVILDCDVGRVFLIVVGDIRKDVAAVCFLHAHERSRHICRIALAALDEFVNVGPVEVCVEHVSAHRGDTHLVGKIGSVFVEERIHNNRAILVVGHKHDASVDDIHFDLARFDVVVLACVVLVRHRDFELLAEVGSDIVIELLIVEFVFDSDELRLVAAVDVDFLPSARFKERAVFRIRVEVELLSCRKTGDACRRNLDSHVHSAFEHDFVAVFGSDCERHVAVEAALCRVVVAPRKRDGDDLLADFDGCNLGQSLIEVVLCKVDCEVAFLVAAGDCSIVSDEAAFKREVVFDRHDEISVDILAVNVSAEDVHLASETAVLDFICSRHCRAFPVDRHVQMFDISDGDGCGASELELVKHVVVVAHSVGSDCYILVEAFEVNLCRERVRTRIAHRKSVEEEVLAFDILAAVVRLQFVLARRGVVNPLDVNGYVAHALCGLCCRLARQLPFVKHVVFKRQRIAFRACDLAAYKRKFAFCVAHRAACELITRDVDVEGNFVVAYRHIDGLRSACSVNALARNDGVEHSDVCDVGFAREQVDLDRRAADCVAPIARLEVVARVGCKVDRVDAERSAVFTDVRLLIYAAGVVAYIRKFEFERVKFRFVVCILSRICRDVADCSRFVPEELYGLYRLLLDVEPERNLLRRIDRIAFFVHLAGVDKCESRAVLLAVRRCVRFYLRVNRTAVKDVLLRFEFGASGVGVILHRRPVGEHRVRAHTHRNVERVVFIALEPGRVESVLVSDGERHGRGLDCVHCDGNVNLLPAAVLSADDEFCIERIVLLIAVSLVCDFVGREFMHVVVVCVAIGFAHLDERRFDLESAAYGQVFDARVALRVFDVDLVCGAEGIGCYRLVLILIEYERFCHRIEHIGFDNDSHVDFLRKLAGETLALADEACLVRRRERLCNRREYAESLTADLCLDCHVKTLVEVYDSVAARICCGDCGDCFCKGGSIPLYVEARHRTFACILAADKFETVQICHKVLHIGSDVHSLEFEDRRVVAV